jgi:catechol 2,3-dioxygenase-like lactoylglutathione lyase family enzyme
LVADARPAWDDRVEMLTGHATVLLVANVRRAGDYYRDRLGFTVSLYEADPALHGSAERDDCHVHFAHYDGASARPNSDVVPPDMFDAYFWPDDVDALHAELEGRGATIISVRPISHTGCASSESKTLTVTSSRLAGASPDAAPKERYEQISRGCSREVRSNVTLPAEESNLAVVGLMRTSVPSWKGLPHPGGGFPLPSDTGRCARQNVPSILAQKMPQCV